LQWLTKAHPMYQCLDVHTPSPCPTRITRSSMPAFSYHTSSTSIPTTDPYTHYMCMIYTHLPQHTPNHSPATRQTHLASAFASRVLNSPHMTASAVLADRSAWSVFTLPTCSSLRRLATSFRRACCLSSRCSRLLISSDRRALRSSCAKKKRGNQMGAGAGRCAFSLGVLNVGEAVKYF
jgi:hypothetical protein